MKPTNAPPNWHRPVRLLVLLALAGCAGPLSYREGLDLMREGKYEEAVFKLGEATREDPRDMVIRKDFFLAREEAGNRLLAAANAARAAERFDAAEEGYRKALRIDPGSGRAQTGLEAVRMDRRHAVIVSEAQGLIGKGDLESATARLKQVLLENPNHPRALQFQRELNERTAKEIASSPSLRANFQKPVTLQFRDANLRMVLESISRTTGINILLDKDVRPDLKATIFVKGTSVEDTIDLILMQNQLEKKVLSDNTLFIYPNVPAKLKDYQDLKVRSFHLVNADVKQMQALLKTILKTRDLFINEKTNSLVMRDTPEAIRLAEKIIADQDIADPEVMLEVEVLEITNTLLSELGIRYPDQMNLSPLVVDAAGAAKTSNITLGDLGQRTRNNIVVSPVPSVTLNAHLDNSNANLLASPRVRVRNREKAKILIGDRVPVLTNSVTPVATGAPVVTGAVSYIDVGLKLDVEPDIHADGEVGIKVSMEVSNIVSQITNPVSGTIAYQIGTRTASTVLRLKDGETQVLAGLINDEDRRTGNMIPGLGELPVLGRLFGTHGVNAKKSEIVLSITPRLMGKLNQQDAQSMEFWSGTESNLRSVPLTLRQAGTVSVSSGSAFGAAQPARTTPLPGAPVPGAPRPQPQPAAPANQPMSFSWQGPVQARVGERFTVTLFAQTGEPFRDLGLQINFDATVLKAVDAVEGTLLKQQGVGSNFTRDINQPAGRIALDMAAAADQGAKGAGSVAAITFEVLTPGQSEITLARVGSSTPSGRPLAQLDPAPHSLTLVP